jgi:hypothetical protein
MNAPTPCVPWCVCAQPEVEAALKRSGHFSNLLPPLFADNSLTVTFALGALRK